MSPNLRFKSILTLLEKERVRTLKEPRTLPNLLKLMKSHASMLQVFEYVEDLIEQEKKK